MGRLVPNAVRTEYDDFSSYYDDWVELIPVTAYDVSFYTSVASTGEGPVVELGVGTGRVAVAIAAQGRRVIGVDISPRMLERARMRAREAGVQDRLTTECADFCEWLPTERVDLVVMPYRTLEDVLGINRDLSGFLRHVGEMLRPGGRFAFNVGNPNPEGLARLNGVEVELGERSVGNERVRISMTNTPEWSTRVVKAEVRVQIDGSNGRRDERRWRFRLGWVVPNEIAASALEAGLELALLQGSFLDSAPSLPGHEQIWILRKGV